MIAIVDYGSGNITGIANVLRRLSLECRFVKTAEDLEGAQKVILPGVGAFDQAMSELLASGIKPALDRWVNELRRPVLGICVGMQLLADESEEGSLPGLGWVKGRVEKFQHESFSQRTHLPHMGWNDVRPVSNDNLFNEVDLQTGYYFLHSYYFACGEPSDILAETSYGTTFTSAVRHQNIYGVQFHPEKSHQAGVQLLKNFATAS